MARHLVSDLIFDDHNEREMARHGVVRYEIEQVQLDRKVFSDNPRGEPGSVLLIGETNGGRLLTVALGPTRRSDNVAAGNGVRRLATPPCIV